MSSIGQHQLFLTYGGVGAGPFRAYGGVTVADTDDYLAVGSSFYASKNNNKLCLLGQQADDIWVHDLSSFASAANQVDAGGTVSPSGERQAGCIARNEGDIVWLSGGSGASVRAYKVSTDTLYDFGTTDTMIVIAGTDDYVIVQNNTAGQIEKYVANFGGPSLGMPTITWTGTTADQVIGIPGIFDGQGNLWWPRTDHMVMINPVSGGAVKTHNYPAAWQVTCPLVYDSLRDRIIASGTSAAGAIYAYSGWDPSTNNSGTWETSPLATLANGAYAIYHEPESDVFLVSDYGVSALRRYVGETWRVLDSVSVDDQGPDNSQVDYDSTTTNTVYYKSGADAQAYGYTVVDKSSQRYIARVEYTGAVIYPV